jgi:hypothetical protein
VTDTAKLLGISKGAVSKALKVLDQKGFIDMELVKVKLKITSKGMAVDEFSVGNERFSEETAVSCRKHSFLVGNNQELEPLLDNGSSSPHTNKDFNQTNTHSKSACEEEEKEEEPKPQPTESKPTGDTPISVTTRHERACQPKDLVEGTSSAAAVQNQLDTRFVNPVKNTRYSRSSDPWMESQDNPLPIFKQWLFQKRVKEAHSRNERSNTFVPSLPNAASEIRNNAARAADLWEEFLQDVNHRVKIFNQCVDSGDRNISEAEAQEIAALAPYSPIAIKQPLQLKPASPTFEALPPEPETPTNNSPKPQNATAYSTYSAQQLPPPSAPPPDFLEKLKNRLSMPKLEHRIKEEPTDPFQKYRGYLHSPQLALRNEAIRWVMGRSDADITYDEEGNIIDFAEIEF